MFGFLVLSFDHFVSVRLQLLGSQLFFQHVWGVFLFSFSSLGLYSVSLSVQSHPVFSQSCLCFHSPQSHCDARVSSSTHLSRFLFYFDNLCSVFSVLSFPFLCLVMSDQVQLCLPLVANPPVILPVFLSPQSPSVSCRVLHTCCVFLHKLQVLVVCCHVQFIFCFFLSAFMCLVFICIFQQ